MFTTEVPGSDYNTKRHWYGWSSDCVCLSTLLGIGFGSQRRLQTKSPGRVSCLKHHFHQLNVVRLQEFRVLDQVLELLGRRNTIAFGLSLCCSEE